MHNPDNLWHYHDTVNEIIHEALHDPENSFNRDGSLNFEFADKWWKHWKEQHLTKEKYDRYFADFSYEFPPTAEELALR